MLYTTLRLLRDNGACSEEYDRFVAFKGKEWGDDKLFSLLEVLNCPDLKEPFGDALWALRCCTEKEAGIKSAQQFAYDCIIHADVVGIYERQFPSDKRIRDCVEVLGRFLAGKASADELRAAARAAGAAEAWVAWAAAEAVWAAEAAWAVAMAAVVEEQREWQQQRFVELLQNS